jgi:hypothetical protein
VGEWWWQLISSWSSNLVIKANDLLTGSSCSSSQMSIRSFRANFTWQDFWWTCLFRTDVDEIKKKNYFVHLHVHWVSDTVGITYFVTFSSVPHVVIYSVWLQYIMTVYHRGHFFLPGNEHINVNILSVHSNLCSHIMSRSGPKFHCLCPAPKTSAIPFWFGQWHSSI